MIATLRADDMMRKEKKSKDWAGHKARPTNRAKTWGQKDSDPRKDRRDWKHNEGITG